MSLKFFNKKFLLLIIFNLTFISKGYAESVYDFLKKEYEYNRIGNFLNIYAHNSHSSNNIRVEKLEVMFQNCNSVPDGSWNNPDRVFSILENVAPQSDNHIIVDARFPESATTRCYRLTARFTYSLDELRRQENKSKKKVDPDGLLGVEKPKEEKNSSKSLLEKLLK